MLIDTHCHIHDDDYPIDADSALLKARTNGVFQVICIGTSVENSKLAIEFAKERENVFTAVGVHPHEAKLGTANLEQLIIDNLKSSKMVAIGEIGLDYHYNHSPRDLQIEILKQQINLALKYDLPIIFHVREAFSDFWQVYDEFIQKGSKIRGVVHSYTDDAKNAKEAIKRGLYIGINGFSTFVKNEDQKLMFKELPLENILIETDAPYLTPAPFRGTVNEPAFVRVIAEHNGLIRGVSIDVIENITTANAKKLFNL